jgi:hypothetical protein
MSARRGKGASGYLVFVGVINLDPGDCNEFVCSTLAKAKARMEAYMLNEQDADDPESDRIVFKWEQRGPDTLALIMGYKQPESWSDVDVGWIERHVVE